MSGFTAYRDALAMGAGFNQVPGAPGTFEDATTVTERLVASMQTSTFSRNMHGVILNSIKNWSSWVSAVCAPEYTREWSTRRQISQFKVTPMGVIPDLGVVPMVKQDSKVVEFEMELGGIGCQWCLRTGQGLMGTDQALQELSNAYIRLMASLEYSSKIAAINAITSRIMSMADIANFYFGGRAVTLSELMQKFNEIFGCVNKGESSLVKLMNETYEIIVRNQGRVNTMIAPDSVVNAPTFSKFMSKFSESGTPEFRTNPDSAYGRFFSWLSQVFRAQSLRLADNSTTTPMQTKIQVGTYYVMKDRTSPLLRGEDKKFDWSVYDIEVWDAHQNSFKKIRIRDAVRNAINDAVSTLPAGGSRRPSRNKFALGRKRYSAGAVFASTVDRANDKKLNEFVSEFVKVLGLSGKPESYREAMFGVNDSAKLDLEKTLSAVGSQLLYGQPVFNNIKNVGAPSEDKFYLEQKAVIDKIEAGGYPMLESPEYAALVNMFLLLEYGMADAEDLKVFDQRAINNSRSTAPTSFAQLYLLSNSILASNPNIEKDKAIFAATLEINNILDSKKSVPILSRENSEHSIAQKISQLARHDISAVKEHLRVSKHEDVKNFCFGDVDDFWKGGTLYGGDFTKDQILTAIDKGEKLPIQVLLIRQFETITTNGIALLADQGEAVKLFHGDPSLSVGHNPMTQEGFASLKIPLGTAVTGDQNMAVIPHTQVVDCEIKGCTTEFINPSVIMDPSGFQVGASKGSIYSVILPEDAEIPPHFSVTGKMDDVPQLAGVNFASETQPGWLGDLRAYLEIDNKDGIDINAQNPRKIQINCVVSRGLCNCVNSSADGMMTVPPADPWTEKMTHVGSMNIRRGGYFNGPSVPGTFHMTSI